MTYLQVNFKFTKMRLFEDPDLSGDGSYILKCALKKWAGRKWSGLPGS